MGVLFHMGVFPHPTLYIGLGLDDLGLAAIFQDKTKMYCGRGKMDRLVD